MAAYLLVMLVLQGHAPAAGAVPLPTVAVLPGPEQTSLIVDLGASTQPINRRTATITVGPAPRKARLTPVVSDRLGVAFVIDTTTGTATPGGGTTVNAWLSAAARFILEAPTGTRAAVVADTSPPALISPPQRGPTGIVRALSGIRPGSGPRRTSEALTLAKDQLPASPPGHRVVVLYTEAPDAGGESAAALGARLGAAGTLLIVVGTAGDSRYWSDAARATGGFFAPAAGKAVAPALDQVATTLRSRYLVQFSTPPTLPARVAVRIDTGKLVLAGEVIVPARATALPPPQRPHFRTAPALATIAGCMLLIGVAALLGHRRRQGDADEDALQQVGTEDVNAMRPPAHGRAAVPQQVRGRAAVRGAPGLSDPPPSAAPSRCG